MLVKHLPLGSRTKSKMAGDPHGQQWGNPEHLMATVINELRLIKVHLHYAGRLKNDSDIPTFVPIVRPGQEDVHAATQAERDAGNALAASLLPTVYYPETMPEATQWPSPPVPSP